MAGTTRSRWKDERTTNVGSIYWSLYNAYNWLSDLEGSGSGCNDVVGNLEGVNPLLINRSTAYSPRLSGTYQLPDSEEYIVFDNVIPDIHSGWGGPDPTAVYSDPNIAEMNEAAWKILAESNPSTPDVGVIQSLGELKDLPSLVRGWGRSLLRNYAQAHLSWRWAIKPMIREMSILSRFHNLACTKFRELRDLKQKGGLRRRVQLGTTSTTLPGTDVFVHTNGAWVLGRQIESYKRRRWGTVVWKLDDDSKLWDMDGEETWTFSRETMTGLNSRGALSAAWELMPWSWLVDWFSNVGTMIDATNNTIGCSATRLCMMQHSTSRTRIFITHQPDWLTISGKFDWHWDRKWRAAVLPVVPFPLPSFPILTAGKMSILASLATLRGVKPPR